MDRDVFKNMMENYSNHPSQLYQEESHEYHETFVDAAHSFFEGDIEAQGEIIEQLEDSTHFQVQSQGSKGDVWRSMEYAYHLTRHMADQGMQDKVDEADQPEQKKALVQNVYTDEDVKEELDEADQQMRAIQVMAGEGAGEYQHPHNEHQTERGELRQLLYRHDGLKKVLKYVGHFMQMANKVERMNYTQDAVSISGAEMGRDVPRAFSSELAMLANDKLKMLFYEKYDKRQLMQFEQGGESNTGKSDVSILIDTSSSMNNLLNKEMFDEEPVEMIHVASAFALAMAQQLKAQDRNVQFYAFDWQCYHLFDSDVDDWPTAFEELVTLKADGGTQTDHALRHAFDDTENDCIVITDGMDTIGDALDKGERRVYCLDLAETKEDTFYDGIWRFSSDGVEEIMQEEIT